MSMDLLVPANLVERWVESGLIKPQLKDINNAFVALIRERDYYLQFKAEIPEDVKTPIWDD